MTRPGAHFDKSAVLPGLFASWDAIDRLLEGLPETGWHALTLDAFGSPAGTACGGVAPDRHRVDTAREPHTRR